jgi:hypothetical protein
MPVKRWTLPSGDQFDGTAGKGLVEFVVGQADGPSLEDSDNLAATVIFYAIKSKDYVDIGEGNLRIEPGPDTVPASQGDSDCIQLELWDDGRSAITKPCNVPVPQTYRMIFETDVLAEEATLTVWWKVGVPGV